MVPGTFLPKGTVYPDLEVFMRVIVLSDVLNDEYKGMILQAAAKVGAEVWFGERESEIPDEFKDAEVLYGFGTETARTSKALKWLSVPSAGVDFLMKPCSFANEDCILTNASGSYGVSIAEHIIAVSLMIMRKIDLFYRESLCGNWIKPHQQKSLKDARITVLGTGDIGCCFAKRAKAFEPEKIIGLCRSGICDCDAFDSIYKVDEIDDILPETDLLVMSLPATTETENILSRERIDKLSDGAYVVNVGRGSAIDEDALADSLEAGRLAGAALDVFRNEPLPKDSRLWTTKNLLITPHIAGNLTLKHTIQKNIELFCENLIRFADGRPMKQVVDRKRGY